MAHRRLTSLAIVIVAGALALPAMASSSIRLDAGRHKSASIEGSLLGASGSQPLVYVAGTPTATCTRPSCDAYALTLSLPKHVRSGYLQIDVHTADPAVGLSLRLYDRKGALIDSGDGGYFAGRVAATTTGATVRVKLPAGAYSLDVLDDGGSISYAGTIGWTRA